MNGSHVNTISHRLSLRPPQRESLEILARVCDVIPLEKDQNRVWHQYLGIDVGDANGKPTTYPFDFYVSLSTFRHPHSCFPVFTSLDKTTEISDRN